MPVEATQPIPENQTISKVEYPRDGAVGVIDTEEGYQFMWGASVGDIVVSELKKGDRITIHPKEGETLTERVIGTRDIHQLKNVLKIVRMS